MGNTFNINYKDREITIERQSADQYNNCFFTAYLPDGEIQMEYTEDDEGAGRWLDTRTNHQTEVSAELGLLIDLYMAEHGVTM